MARTLERRDCGGEGAVHRRVNDCLERLARRGIAENNRTEPRAVHRTVRGEHVAPEMRRDGRGRRRAGGRYAVRNLVSVQACNAMASESSDDVALARRDAARERNLQQAVIHPANLPRPPDLPDPATCPTRPTRLLQGVAVPRPPCSSTASQ